jgi:hypothetical protein
MSHSRSPVALCLALVTLVCGGCAVSHKPVSAVPSPTHPASISRRFPAVTVIPTYSGLATETTTCGSWLLQATSPSGTFPLLNCGAAAGDDGGTAIQVKVGDQVLVTGWNSTRISLTASPKNLVAQSGLLFLAKAPGITTVIVSGWSCSSVPPAASAPKTCPLLTIAAS